MKSAYGSASYRSWADAETLFRADRLGTPDHLYGLAAECALKAILHAQGAIPAAPAMPPKPYNKHVNGLWSEYSTWVSGQGLAKFGVSTPCPFDLWKIDHRYEHDSWFTAARVEGHRAGALEARKLLEQAYVDGIVK